MSSVNTINLNDINVFQRYYKSMYRQLHYFTCRYIDDEEAIDDVIQDMWLKIWEQQMTFSCEATFKSYLYTTLRNDALNYLRTQMREQKRYKCIQNWQENEQDVLYRMIEAELYASVNKVFANLSPACKNVYLESLKGKSQKEIAEQLHISINTVKKHINNANHSMREQIEKLLLLLSLFR